MFTYLGFCGVYSFLFSSRYWVSITRWYNDTCIISDKTKINNCLFPRRQVFTLGIRLTRLTIPRSLNSFKGEVFFFFSLSVLYAAWLWNLGFFHIPNYVLSFSMNKRQLLMYLHPSTNKRQLLSFRSLKIYHMLAFWLKMTLVETIVLCI